MPRFVGIPQIEVLSTRQRKKIEAKPLDDLKQSILNTGLINAIVVLDLKEKDAAGLPKFRLVAGGRRLAAMTALSKEKQTFKHEEMEVPKDSVPVTVLKDRDLYSLLTVEYDENVVRVDLDWQEQVEAISQIEKAREEPTRTARRQEVVKTLVQASEAAGKPRTVAAVRSEVMQALTVAAVIEDRPDLQKAKSRYEAYKIILREEEERFSAELARRRLKKVDSSRRLWDLKRGDAKEVLPTLEDGLVDLLLVDPPYGIDINKEKYAASTLHRYDDSEQYARDLCIFIIQEGWRLTKNRANLFMFCSFESFPVLKEAAAKYGWTPWYHPLIWQKSQGEGEAPWGRQGFIKTYEMLLFATKGQRGINGPIPDVLPFSKVAARSRVHGAEKPAQLLEFLIEKATTANDLVLDPCAGSGSTLLAATKKQRRVIGVELDETYFNRAMTRMSNFEEGKPDEPEPEAPSTDGPLMAELKRSLA